ncbi:MAG: hypothetical protein HN368_06480 [Spirochaetales bacterium]|jgi:hypothetical protein|nr:hypothetical protein [Spirochaetales bacterium]
MRDPGFDYLLNSRELYSPKTPRAALKAVEVGLLPGEAFIYKANSIHPLREEPIDFDAIERTLAQKGKDVSTNTLLVTILELLLVDKDSEIALFAAESINAIENSYNERIEGLKKEHRDTSEPRCLRDIARQFYELAMINESRNAIRNFYLFESYSYMKRFGAEIELKKEDIIFVLRIMITLKSYRLARGVIVQALQESPNDTDLIILAAEIEYFRRNYRQVFALFQRLGESWHGLPESLKTTFQHWVSVDSDE